MPLLSALPSRVTPTKKGISVLYVAATEDLDTIQTDTNGVIATAHVATSPKGFYDLPLNPLKQGKLGWKKTGTYPISEDEAMVEAEIVGLSIEQVQEVKAMKGKLLLLLVKDGDCAASGFLWQVGCKCRPATLESAEYDTDTLILKCTFKATCDLKKYTAAVPLAS